MTTNRPRTSSMSAADALRLCDELEAEILRRGESREIAKRLTYWRSVYNRKHLCEERQQYRGHDSPRRTWHGQGHPGTCQGTTGTICQHVRGRPHGKNVD